MKKEITSLSDLADLAGEICKVLQSDSIILFRGELGVGKTTLVSYILQRLVRASETFTSPTFNIVNHYYSEVKDCDIYHLDLYRIEDENELYEIGLNDMIGKGIILIEWPEIAMNILSKSDVIMINLSFLKEDLRGVVITNTCKDPQKKLQYI